MQRPDKAGQFARKWPLGRKSSLVKRQIFLLTPALRLKDGLARIDCQLITFQRVAEEGICAINHSEGADSGVGGGVGDPNTDRQGEKSWPTVGRLTLGQPPGQ